MTCSTAKSWKNEVSRPLLCQHEGLQDNTRSKAAKWTGERCVGREHYVMNVVHDLFRDAGTLMIPLSCK